MFSIRRPVGDGSVEVGAGPPQPETSAPATTTAASRTERAIPTTIALPGRRLEPGPGQLDFSAAVQPPAPSASNAATTPGSNCAPAAARISPAASSTLQASL